MLVLFYLREVASYTPERSILPCFVGSSILSRSSFKCSKSASSILVSLSLTRAGPSLSISSAVGGNAIFTLILLTERLSGFIMECGLSKHVAT